LIGLALAFAGNNKTFPHETGDASNDESKQKSIEMVAKNEMEDQTSLLKLIRIAALVDLNWSKRHLP